ncbi:YHYH domain-containing protein [Acinetobacter sichuanensis]
MKKLLVVLIVSMFTTLAYSHSGGTDKNGCHKDSKTGSRHCH